MSWSATRPLPNALDRLEAGMTTRLVLIVAPAGAGKTRLLRQWAAWRSGLGQRPPGWISLTDRDNNLTNFLPHLISAVAGIDEEFTRLISSTAQLEEFLLIDESKPPLLTCGEDCLTELINTLARAPAEFALILDEYHWIHASEIHQALSFLLEYLPAQAHLYLAARRSPPLHLAHLRARRELIEISLQEISSWIEMDP